MSILSARLREQTKIARKLVKSGNLAMHIASVALAVEALEGILVEKGVLKKDELMERLEVIRQQYYAAGDFIPPSED